MVQDGGGEGKGEVMEGGGPGRDPGGEGEMRRRRTLRRLVVPLHHS